MKFLTPEQMEKPRKRRLRKKLRLGEFQEFGFSFELTYDRNVLSHDDALDHLIDFVEAQAGCSAVAARRNRRRSAATCAWRGSAAWTRRTGKAPACGWKPNLVQDLEVGPLSDCWHNFFE